MDSSYTKPMENIYFRCRKEAAIYNDDVISREKASELLNISVSTLSNYELGITTPPVDIIVRMADIYNAPQLMNSYCKCECPLGKTLSISTEIKSLEGAALKLIRRLDDKDITNIKNELIDIAEDGQITDDEVERLDSILKQLDELTKVISDLKLISQKRRK